MSYRPYLLQCKCGAMCHSKGTEDPSTNSAEYEPDPGDWEGGDPECEHEDFECIDVDHDCD